MSGYKQNAIYKEGRFATTLTLSYSCCLPPSSLWASTLFPLAAYSSTSSRPLASAPLSAHCFWPSEHQCFAVVLLARLCACVCACSVCVSESEKMFVEETKPVYPSDRPTQVRQPNVLCGKFLSWWLRVIGPFQNASLTSRGVVIDIRLEQPPSGLASKLQQQHVHQNLDSSSTFFFGSLFEDISFPQHQAL